ncbi:MAG: hypothetical protein PHV38_00225 [Eubacteriales bacterium]|nr:hypothetical protein [Eubacteriales bacterium]
MKRITSMLIILCLLLSVSSLILAEDTNPAILNDFRNETAGVPGAESDIWTVTPQCTELEFVQSTDLSKLVAKVTGTMSTGDAAIDMTTLDDNGVDGTGKDMLELWIDMSEFADPALKLRFWTKDTAEEPAHACLELSAETPFYYIVDGEWVEMFDDYGRLVLPDGYKGYVRIALQELLESPSPYEGTGINGDITNLWRLRFWWTNTNENKFQPVSFGNVRFIDSTMDEPASSSEESSTADPVSEAPQTSDGGSLLGLLATITACGSLVLITSFKMKRI